METYDQSNNKGYPSHLVPMEEKGKNWCLSYIKAFHTDYKAASGTADFLFRNQTENYARWRLYAKGKQDHNQYKELLGVKKNKGKRNPTYRNLDWSILKVAPKLKEVLKGKILNRPLKISTSLIDPKSLNQQRQSKFEMLEYIVNKDNRKAIEDSTGVSLPKPANAENVPNEVDKVDEFIQNGGYKSELAKQMEDYINLCFAINDFEQIKEECADDLIDTGVLAIKCFIDSNGFIRLRRGIPENMITNRCIHNNFKDKIRVGEYIQMTIADLKQRVGYKDGWTEETYMEIANKVSGETGKYSAYSWQNLTEEDKFAYDHEKVTCLDVTWFSVDNEVKVVRKDKAGNKKLYDKAPNYVPYKGSTEKPEIIPLEMWRKNLEEGKFKGIDDEKYKELYQGEREVIRNEIKNVYQGTWVVDTDYIYDFGLATDMARAMNNLADVDMNWIIQTSDFESIIGRIESALDNIQIQWLQYQSHSAQSKPAGIAIEKNALARLGQTGKGGDNFDPKEAIKMYMETGSYIYDGYDADGKPLTTKPFEELKGGMSETALLHYTQIFQEIDLIRFMLGLNDITDATGPNPRQGKAVSQMVADATDNALTSLYKAFNRTIKGTGKCIADMIPSAIDKGMHTGFVEALGIDTYHYFKLNRDLNLSQIGIDIQMGIDDLMRERLFQIAQASVQKGELMEEDAIVMLEEENLWRAKHFLARRRHEIRIQKRDDQMMMDRNKALGDKESAEYARELEKEVAELNHQLDLAKEREIHRMKLEEDNNKAKNERDLLILKGQVESGNIENKITGDLLKENEKGENAKDIKRMELEKQEKQPASQ